MWERRNEKVAIKYEITTFSFELYFFSIKYKSKELKMIFFLGSCISKPSSGYKSEEIS
jgi:hypothetical protein